MSKKKIQKTKEEVSIIESFEPESVRVIKIKKVKVTNKEFKDK